MGLTHAGTDTTNTATITSVHPNAAHPHLRRKTV